MQWWRATSALEAWYGPSRLLHMTCCGRTQSNMVQPEEHVICVLSI